MDVLNSGIQRFFHKPASFQSVQSEERAGQLQDKLYGLFLGMYSMGIEDVKRAYLADVQYEGITDARLAICLIADRSTAEQTTSEIAKVYENICKAGELDVLFVSEEQEQQVRATCNPFFSA
jgi:SseB protein C-terminal domain